MVSQSSGESRNLKGMGVEGNESAPSHLIANVHDKLYALYTGKCDLLKKILRPIREGRGASPFNLPLAQSTTTKHCM